MAGVTLPVLFGCWCWSGVIHGDTRSGKGHTGGAETIDSFPEAGNMFSMCSPPTFIVLLKGLSEVIHSKVPTYPQNYSNRSHRIRQLIGRETRLSDTAALQSLFPRLSVTFFRISDIERGEEQDERFRGRRSFIPHEETTNITQVKATVHRPIRPLELAAACVIGTQLRQTSVAGTTTSQPENFDPQDTCYLPDYPPNRPERALVVDNLCEVTFEATRTFLRQGTEETLHFPATVGQTSGNSSGDQADSRGGRREWSTEGHRQGRAGLVAAEESADGTLSKVSEDIACGISGAIQGNG